MGKIRLAVKFILKFLKWFLISSIILFTLLIVVGGIMNELNKAPEYVNPYKDWEVPNVKTTSSYYESWNLIKTLSGNPKTINEDFYSLSFSVNSEKLLMVAEAINVSNSKDFELVAYIKPINITDSSEAIQGEAMITVNELTSNPSETIVSNIKSNLKYVVEVYSSHQWKVKVYEWK